MGRERKPFAEARGGIDCMSWEVGGSKTRGWDCSRTGRTHLDIRLLWWNPATKKLNLPSSWTSSPL